MLHATEVKLRDAGCMVISPTFSIIDLQHVSSPPGPLSRSLVNFALWPDMKSHLGVEVQLYSFCNLSARWGWVVNATPRSLFARERDPGHIVEDAGWAPAPVCTCAENFAATGIRSPDRPSRSEWLYRLSYPGSKDECVKMQYCVWLASVCRCRKLKCAWLIDRCVK